MFQLPRILQGSISCNKKEQQTKKYIWECLITVSSSLQLNRVQRKILKTVINLGPLKSGAIFIKEEPDIFQLTIKNQWYSFTEIAGWLYLIMAFI